MGVFWVRNLGFNRIKADKQEISNSPPSMLLPEVGKWSKMARFGTSLLLKNGHHAISVLGMWTLRIFLETLLPQNHRILNIQTSLKFMRKEFWDPRKFPAPIIGSFKKKKPLRNKPPHSVHPKRTRRASIRRPFEDVFLLKMVDFPCSAISVYWRHSQNIQCTICIRSTPHPVTGTNKGL